MTQKVQKINYINGIRLHRAIVTGIRKVISNQDYLNKINVFPVPDGDTGTNMAFTLTSILDTSYNKVNSRVDDMLVMVADAALDGARGNSGAILAQFFQGLSDGTKGVDNFNPITFSNAIKKGAEYAREALSDPREGTILTVISDFSNSIKNSVDSNECDFEILLFDALKAAKDSLNNTPNLMDVLKRAGVVDSGGQGFVDFIEGINDFISFGSLKEFESNSPDLKILEAENLTHDISDKTWQFCTECLITGKSINRKKLRSSLEAEGGSIVIAGSNVKVKVHIHTNYPSNVFTICESFGIVSSQKADDMFKQQELIQNDEKAEIAIVTDSAADFNTEKFDIHVVPVRYNFGEKGYIDKVSQTIPEFYKELATNPKHPQTSQPVPGDFNRQYQLLGTHYNSIISIHIPNAVSGTMQSAKTAAKRLPESSVTVIDSLNISVGQGLIVTHAARLVNAGKNHDEVIKGIKFAKGVTRVYCCVNDLSYSVRGGRVPHSIKVIADLFHLHPILTTASNGKLEKSGVVFGRKNLGKKMVRYMNKKHDNKLPYRISIGHCNCPMEGKILLDGIKKTFTNLISIELLEVGGALGVHTGPGSLVVAIQDEIKI